MNQPETPTVADLLQRREELKAEGIDISVEELCRGATAEMYEEASIRLRRIERAERAVKAAWQPLRLDRSTPFVPEGCAGRYANIRVKEQGGMGVLCIADDLEVGRQVAYKVLKPTTGPEDLARTYFFNEAEITSRLNHPGIVPIYGRVLDGSGQPAYTSAFISGESLAARVERLWKGDAASRSRDRPLLLDAFTATCEVVAYAHSQGVVHGDVKPSNIVIDEYDAIRLVDWGLAKVMTGDAIAEQKPLPALRPGTWPFVSAFDRPATFASDIYALGLTLALILAEPRSVNSRKLRLSFDMPPALWAVAQKAMNLDDHSRYTSASDLASDVRSVLADRPIACHVDSIPTRVRRLAARHKTIVAAIAVFLVVVGMAGPFVAARESQLRRIANQKRTAAVELSREMLTQADHVGKLQASLPASKNLLGRTIRLIEQLERDGEQSREGLGAALESYYRAGRIYQNLGQLPEAAACFRKAVDLSEDHAQDLLHDESNLDLHAAVLRELGVVSHRQGRTVEASEYWGRGIALLSPIDGKSAPCRYTLARLLYAVGNGKMLGGRQVEALSDFEESRQIVSNLIQGGSQDPRYLQALADVQHNIGLALYYRAISGGGVPVDQGLLAQSRAAYAECLRQRRRLVALESGNPDYLADLAAVLNKVGNVEQSGGPDGFDVATNSYREAATILEALILSFPGVLTQQRDLAHIYSNMNVILAKQGRYDEARAAAKSAVERLRRILSIYQNTSGLYSDLGVALTQQAETLSLCGEVENSLESRYQAAVSMARAAPLTGDPTQRESLVRSSLATLADLKRRGFFKSDRHAIELMKEPTFANYRNRNDFPK